MASHNAARGSDRGSSQAQSSLIEDLNAAILKLLRRSALPLPDRLANELTEQLYEATVKISNAPAAGATEIDLKLALLCHRLREHLHPDHRGELLTLSAGGVYS